MKRTVRKGIFETNSSMTHTLVIGSKEEFDKWDAGKLFYCMFGKYKGFYTEEEMDACIADDDNYVDRADFCTKEEFDSDYGCYEFEHDSGSFKSPSGDEMCWVAAYGRDG